MRFITVENCPACGCEATTTVFTPRPKHWECFEALSDRKYKGCMNAWMDHLDLQVKECADCQHLWHHTHPEFLSLLEMYGSSVPLNSNAVSHEPNATVLKSMKNLFSLAKSISNETPTFLDYGSGRGKWSKAAVRAGFQVWAYEPSESRSSDGFKEGFVLVNELNELNGLCFDVVNLEQVLEHAQDPYEILRGLTQFLKNDSVLRITTPNISRFRRKKLWNDFPFSGDSMHLLSPYEHLQGFNSLSIKRLLRRAGFSHITKIEAWKTHPLQMIRYLVGTLFSDVATTFALVSPNVGVDSLKPKC